MASRWLGEPCLRGATVPLVSKKKAAKRAEKTALKKAALKAGIRKPPKTECCVSKTRCTRCPIRMLKEGTLPEGYTVRKRKLVKAKKAKAPIAA